MTIQTYLVPLTPEPQVFSIQLGLKTYSVNLYWNAQVEGGWTMDFSDTSGNAILQGVPLVTGIDLLAQYEYLGFGGTLVATTDDSPDTPPTYTNLGSQANVYFTTAIP